MTTHRVTIVNAGMGTLKVHREGCADVKKAPGGSAVWTVEVASQRAVIEDAFECIINDEEGVTWEDCAGDVVFLPCCPKLPIEAPAEATAEPVVENLVTTAPPAEAPAMSAPVKAHDTREAWLVEAIEAMRPLFAEVGEEIPTVRVSVGWPGGRGKKGNVIGQCWNSHAAADKVAQVFISPVLDKAADVLATLAHELVHAVDDCQSGHKGRFAKVAKGIGLAGKMTATHAGEELAQKLAAMSDFLGPYPHARLANPSAGQGEKKQSTRMIKCQCECGYTARTTRKWLDEVGPPLCPCNREPMTVA
ncbi:hypothetical protein [Micromonospora sp. NPDC023956]|uniref:hypothetical protein n=1 Tax=Micromonospora sp. NPDC023956 TaxID=3155722 RepID=UPI003406E292